MKFHIVRMNETIEDIMFIYELTLDEIKEENRHIKKWNQLIPGTKIKIPVISKQMDDEISNMEPFIEDYYPKVERFSDVNLNIYTKDEPKELKDDLVNEENNREEELVEKEIINEELKEENVPTIESKEENVRKEKNDISDSPSKTSFVQKKYFYPYPLFWYYPVSMPQPYYRQHNKLGYRNNPYLYNPYYKVKK